MKKTFIAVLIIIQIIFDILFLFNGSFSLTKEAKANGSVFYLSSNSDKFEPYPIRLISTTIFDASGNPISVYLMIPN